MHGLSISLLWQKKEEKKNTTVGGGATGASEVNVHSSHAGAWCHWWYWWITSEYSSESHWCVSGPPLKATRLRLYWGESSDKYTISDFIVMTGQIRRFHISHDTTAQDTKWWCTGVTHIVYDAMLIICFYIRSLWSILLRKRSVNLLCN